jgi:hypothetical protein
MVSNLSTIGFHFDDDDAFHETMQRLTAGAFERLACGPGDYAIWRSRTSAEVWFHLTGERDAGGALKDNGVVGLTPFFEGLSDVPVEVVEAIVRKGDNDFEGAFLAWVNPDEETGLGAHQIVFDAVDFAAHCDRPMPFKARVKLSGFAREIKIVGQDDKASMARVASTARSFMSIGLFPNLSASGGGASDAPSSNALLTGRVVELSTLMNEETRANFHWLLVQSPDATFDILADPALVPANVAVGDVIQVGCLFFGRIIG